MEKTKKVHADDLHFEHKLWNNQLSFYNDELHIFQNRLDEVARRNNEKDVTIKIEQFQNKFLIQKNQLDQLKHDINHSEQKLAASAEKNPIAFDHHLFHDHEGERKKVETFAKLYSELKQDFYTFISECF
jgi:hypothetical protein